MSAAGVFELDSDVDGQRIVERVAVAWGARNGQVDLWNRYRPDAGYSSASPPTAEQQAVFEKIEEMATKAMGEIVEMLSRDYGIEADPEDAADPTDAARLTTRGASKDTWPSRGTCPQLYASDKEWVCTIGWYVNDDQRADFEAAVRELCALARGDVFYYRDDSAMTEAGLAEDEPFPERALGLDEIGTFPPDPGDQGTRYVLPGGRPA